MNSNKHFQIRPPEVMVGRARHILAFLCTVRSMMTMIMIMIMIMIIMIIMMIMIICLFDNDDDVDSVLVFFCKHGNEGMD